MFCCLIVPASSRWGYFGGEACHQKCRLVMTHVNASHECLFSYIHTCNNWVQGCSVHIYRYTVHVHVVQLLHTQQFRKRTDWAYSLPSDSLSFISLPSLCHPPDHTLGCAFVVPKVRTLCNIFGSFQTAPWSTHSTYGCKGLTIQTELYRVHIA